MLFLKIRILKSYKYIILIFCWNRIFEENEDIKLIEIYWDGRIMGDFNFYFEFLKIRFKI